MDAQVHKVLIADDSLRPDGIRMLERSTALTLLPPWPSEEQLVDAARDVDAILSRSAMISAHVIAASPRLKIVSRHGVGLDYVDVEACTEHGVLVTTTGDANSQAVSEQAFALLLAVARRVAVGHAGMRAGDWADLRSRLVGTQLYKKTLGIVGLGRIGSRVARQAKGFEMEVIACDPYIDPGKALALGVTLVDLETLLRRSDVVSMHVPLTGETRGMIGQEAFGLMRPSAILINTARGPVVNEQALLEALTAQKLAGVGLDVFCEEPLPKDHPLTKFENVVCSPHVAAQTDESMVGMSVQAAENILCVLRGELPPFVANPEVVNRTTRIAWQR